MTTLVALSTKDALVMGCDSLASATAPFIDPSDLMQFFDSDNEFTLRLDDNGQPLLQSFEQVYVQARHIPFDHMTHVSKLFSLAPLEMGVMTAGAVSIGDRTVKSLINEFKTRDNAFNQKRRPTNYTVRSIGQRLLNFIDDFYVNEYSENMDKPELELIIGGYDKQKQTPSIYRIKLPECEVEDTIGDNFGIVFGGQMREIQRIVFGCDYDNKNKILFRSVELLHRYRELLSTSLNSHGITAELPPPEDFAEQLSIYSDGWDLDGFIAEWGDFSEQNAIECVDFFIDIMIKSQQFSSRLPTVGGEVHIALVTKTDKFRFVSREELRHKEHVISISEQPK